MSAYGSWRVLLFCALFAAAVTPSRASARSVLYPRGAPALRFSHAKHRQVVCARCHVGVEKSISANDRHTPKERACRPCHADKTRPRDSQREASSNKAAKACASCHLGYTGGAPRRVWKPAARLRFSHRVHADGGVGCKACHAMQGAPNGEGGAKSMPTMATCRACHARKKATQRCAACHLTQKDGRLITRFGAARLRPSGSLVGAEHGPLFARKHANVARRNERFCQSCHQPQNCQRCHAGTFRPLRIHRSDYATHHALDARLDQPRCSSCHRSQSFCLSCHQRSGVGGPTARGGFAPSTGLAYHPRGFASRQVGPEHHSISARRNIRTCTSCHTEKSCIRCHGTTRLRRGGFSPHGPGFSRSAKCRALSARNQRVCLKCHAAGDAKLFCR